MVLNDGLQILRSLRLINSEIKPMASARTSCVIFFSRRILLRFFPNRTFSDSIGQRTIITQRSTGVKDAAYDADTGIHRVGSYEMEGTL